MADMHKAGRKAAVTRKWKKAQKQSVVTAKNAMTFAKVELNRQGWKYAEFKSKKGFPRTGIVDLVALKIDRKDPDKINVILFQVKGGKANRISEDERRRLLKAVRKVEVTFNCCEKPEKTPIFNWEPTDEQFDLNIAKNRA